MRYGTKEHAAAAVGALEKLYPAAECALKYEGESWRLLVMARLSAQCTDKRVNEVSEILFEKYPSPEKLADADISDIEKIVRPCGLYHVKAKDIKEECLLLVTKYGGTLPSDIDELLTFPGVGRKIANLIVGDIFGAPAIVCDTHCIRISERLGLVPKGEKNPQKIEKILAKRVEPDKQSDFCHRLVMFGREYCPARGQVCENCPLAAICRFGRSEKQADKKKLTES